MAARYQARGTPVGYLVDEKGRLRLAGRSKEMYVRGGYNVYPMEVEAVMAEHPAVAGVALAGAGTPRSRRCPAA